MSTEQNTHIARRVAEDALGAGNFALLDELCAPGPAAEARATFEMIRTAFPDVRITVEDTIAEGEKVALRVHSAGTHQRPLPRPMGMIPPTGKRTEWDPNVIQHFRDGKIVAFWPQTDLVRLLQQLSVMPTPPS